MKKDYIIEKLELFKLCKFLAQCAEQSTVHLLLVGCIEIVCLWYICHKILNKNVFQKRAKHHLWVASNFCIIFTARKRSLGQGNIFTPVCHSVHRGACVVARGVCGCRGGMCGGGACMVAGGWLWGAGMVAGGRVWLQGGVHGCGGSAWLQGVCMLVGGGMCIGYDEIRSMSGQYASYFHAFLYENVRGLFEWHFLRIGGWRVGVRDTAEVPPFSVQFVSFSCSLTTSPPPSWRPFGKPWAPPNHCAVE